MSVYVPPDPDDRPTLAELYPDVPMWLTLRVCECGRVGEYAHTRCGRDGRTNMRVGCPTINIRYIVAEEADR